MPTATLEELSNECRSKKIGDGAETKETELDMLQKQWHKGLKDWESVEGEGSIQVCITKGSQAGLGPLQSHALSRMVTLAIQVTGVGESTCFAPDRECLHYLIQGIREGFRVGFDHQSPLRSSEGNMTSAQEQATAVAK